MAQAQPEHRSERETRRAKDRPPGGNARAPDRPGQLEGSSKIDTIKRTFKEFSADNGTDYAAALTYYGVLAVFPALIALVSLLGLFGQGAIDELIKNMDEVAPGPAKEIVTAALENLKGNEGAAGIAFVIGLVLALNSASGYIGAFTRASNEFYEVEEGRPIWKRKPAQIGITLVLLVLIVLVTVGVAVTGPLAEEVGKVLGVGDTAATIWDFAKIPVILAAVSFMFAFLYWAAPNVKQPGFRWITPGGVLALVVWILASLAFAFYVATFASYNETYGSLGGVVAFLVWLWITNIAILLGAELNAELQRSQRIEAGHDAPLDEPFLEPRDTAKLTR